MGATYIPSEIDDIEELQDELDSKATSAALTAEAEERAAADSALQTAVGLKAPLASPALTGIPTAPTAATATDSTQVATTAFVHALAATILAAPPSTLDTLQELAAALGDDPNFATTITNLISAKVAKASNLSDLVDIAAARVSLGLGTMATQAETDYALLAGRAGGQSLTGGTAANDDLTIQGTSHATRTTSYVNLQPNGGNVGIGTANPAANLQIAPSGQYSAIDGNKALLIYNPSATAANLAFGINGSAANSIQSRDGASTGYSLALNPFGGNVGINKPIPTAQLHILSSAAATKGLIVQGAAAASGNLTEWQKSDGTTIYSTISENGYITTRKVTAPADAELSNSEMTFWLDDTVGATKVKFKAKDSAGNVCTGEIALA